MAMTIEGIRKTLDDQSDIAIWYTIYSGSREAIHYANDCFAQSFGLSVTQVLERERYHLVNPPETTAETIEQYKHEDQQAIEKVYFFSCTSLSADQLIIVVKLRFGEGMLGLFKIIPNAEQKSLRTLENMDTDMHRLVETLCPDFAS